MLVVFTIEDRFHPQRKEMTYLGKYRGSYSEDFYNNVKIKDIPVYTIEDFRSSEEISDTMGNTMGVVNFIDDFDFNPSDVSKAYAVLIGGLNLRRSDFRYKDSVDVHIRILENKLQRYRRILWNLNRAKSISPIEIYGERYE